MMIAILGPDGCGKSTLIDALLPQLREHFSNVIYFHLMPSVALLTHSVPTLDPYAKKPYNPIFSILKLTYLIFKYWLGYLWHLRLFLSKNTIVVFDRYYVDVLVDPLRFRYAGPEILAKFAECLIPSPNYFFLLHTSPEVLQSRKQEVSFEESKRQCDAYLAWAEGKRNVLIVEANNSIEGITTSCLEKILTYHKKKVYEPCS